jgi:hypothetical protein
MVWWFWQGSQFELNLELIDDASLIKELHRSSSAREMATGWDSINMNQHEGGREQRRFIKAVFGGLQR